ncbi:acetyltransferase [Baia soyae]|uniref:Sugar O-acyltransferase (Sialic acid O-acetyltransferase NeuD family) n=1 Tax=Baia soyae TaxID=1544746 RepID=A0A4R2RMF3_9BACL|nr:acetyltransferase [Baia soyae]TCP64118.1 sugar O-acyltransferase (sialic acid O-acetyltransferase NeuD family) [Baia soyae]
MSQLKPLVIWGCGGHAREVNHLCEQIGCEVVGFLDERPEMKGKIIDDIPVLGDLTDILSRRNHVEIVCAGVGDPALKKRFARKTIELEFSIAPSLIHPSVYLSKRSHVGVGSVICEGVILTTRVEIGDFVIINRGANISHDNQIGNYVTIAPGVNIAGHVVIEEGAYLGIGCSVREKIGIGAWSMVGGGAFVHQDVPDKVLYAGVPAQFKKERVVGDE